MTDATIVGWNNRRNGDVETVMSDLESIIGSLRAAIDGEVCSRSRVMDALLDLRLDAGGRVDVIELVDEALRDLPGKNTVTAEWWRERLDAFEIVSINPVEPVA
jgi:hypothetical protein